jgi:tetratricopeptide (TPR) repeat protein
LNLTVSVAKRLLHSWGGRFLLCLLLLTGCQHEPADVFEAVSASVVVIWASDTTGDALGQGSGVVLPDSIVVTNCHVVDDATRVRVSQGKDTVEAVLAFRDRERDLCLLQLGRNLGKPAVIGKSQGLRIGQRVFTVGAPVGMELTIGEGVLSGYREFDSSRYLQTSAPISPGSSGGGLWDGNGRLLGITSFYEEYAQNINFAAPVEWVAQIASRSSKVKTDAQASRWFLLGPQLMEKRDWGGLRDLSRRWIAKEPQSAWAWYCRGVAARNLNESLDTTTHAFHKALQLNEAFGEAWEELALAWHDHDSLELEYQHHLRASQHLSGNFSVWFNLGTAAMQLGHPRDALQAYRAALAINDRSVHAWVRMGMALLDMGRSEEAEAAWTHAGRLDSSDCELLKGRALRWQRLKRSDSSMAAWKKLLDRAPQEWIAWHNLGMEQLKQGKWQQSAVSFQEAVRLDPEDEQGWIALSRAQAERGALESALETLQASLKINESSSRLWNAYGMTALKAGKGQLAWDAFAKTVRLDPYDAAGWGGRALAALCLGRAPQALADARRAVRLDRNNATAKQALELTLQNLTGRTRAE